MGDLELQRHLAELARGNASKHAFEIETDAFKATIKCACGWSKVVKLEDAVRDAILEHAADDPFWREPLNHG